MYSAVVPTRNGKGRNLLVPRSAIDAGAACLVLICVQTAVSVRAEEYHIRLGGDDKQRGGNFGPSAAVDRDRNVVIGHLDAGRCIGRRGCVSGRNGNMDFSAEDGSVVLGYLD